MKKIRYELRNICHFGIAYEIHRIQQKLGIINKLPLKYVLMREKFFEKNPEEIKKEVEALYQYRTGHMVNFEPPKKYTEKIQWMKLYDSTPIKTKLADKFLVRSWVAEKIGEEHLISLYGAWDSFSQIGFEALPNEFVLKCNHGSGANMVVRDKSKMDKKKAKEEFDYVMTSNFAYNTMELHYRDIPRKIIAEQYIEETGGGLCDYKVHCFGGKPKFIQVIGDRDLGKHVGHQKFYDFDWKDMGWTFEDYPSFSQELSKPSCLDEIYQCAKLLSQDFKYVRVDFYAIDGKVLFGEMTFTPASGIYPYCGSWTEERDLLLGSWISM